MRSQEALNSKDISSLEMVQASLDQAEKRKSLGAFIHIEREFALQAAKKADALRDQGKELSPLHGIPFIVKDNIHVAGMPNTAGTPALKGFVPEKNNQVVQALIDAGAVVIGKANMHELAFGITSNNIGFGAVHNAVDPSLIAGGSSGGTAVAVAAGIVPIGLGTDTGGSLRIPPALNGVAGLRPTMGRYNSEDVTPISQTRDTIGPIAESVQYLAIMDAVITGDSAVTQAADLGDVRLGVPRSYFYENLDSEVSRVIEGVLTELTNAGVELIEVDLPGLQQANDNVSFPVCLYEVMKQLPAYLEDYQTGISWQELLEGIASPDVIGVLNSQLGDEAIPEEVYQQAMKQFRPELQGIYKSAFTKYQVDALIVPTTPLPAAPLATSDEVVELNGEQVPTFLTYIRNTDPTSNAGLPSLAMPAGVTGSGLPVSLQLDGLADSDHSLLQIGIAIEQLLAKR